MTVGSVISSSLVAFWQQLLWLVGSWEFWVQHLFAWVLIVYVVVNKILHIHR